MSETAPPPRTENDPNWSRRLKVWGGITVAFLLALLIGGAFIPRWWAHRVGDQANESFAGGIMLGLFYGFVFTCAAAAADRLGHSPAALGAHVAVDPRRRGAARAAEPLHARHRAGPGSGAHAGTGRSTSRHRAFADATLAGALLAVAAIGFVWYLLSSRRRARDELRARRPGQSSRWTSEPGRTFAPSS